MLEHALNACNILQCNNAKQPTPEETRCSQLPVSVKAFSLTEMLLFASQREGILAQRNAVICQSA